jgi:hypothetical protein
LINRYRVTTGTPRVASRDNQLPLHQIRCDHFDSYHLISPLIHAVVCYSDIKLKKQTPPLLSPLASDIPADHCCSILSRARPLSSLSLEARDMTIRDVWFKSIFKILTSNKSVGVTATSSATPGAAPAPITGPAVTGRLSTGTSSSSQLQQSPSQPVTTSSSSAMTSSPAPGPVNISRGSSFGVSSSAPMAAPVVLPVSAEQTQLERGAIFTHHQLLTSSATAAHTSATDSHAPTTRGSDLIIWLQRSTVGQSSGVTLCWSGPPPSGWQPGHALPRASAETMLSVAAITDMRPGKVNPALTACTASADCLLAVVCLSGFPVLKGLPSFKWLMFGLCWMMV